MQGQKLVYSPVSLWKNFDSTSLPFEQEVVKVEESDGIVYTHIYFNGVQHEDGISRVYGVFGAKKNKKDLPAIVIVSDVGKGINQHEISFWAKKGYAVFGFDNTGKNDDQISRQHKLCKLSFCWQAPYSLRHKCKRNVLVSLGDKHPQSNIFRLQSGLR